MCENDDVTLNIIKTKEERPEEGREDIDPNHPTITNNWDKMNKEAKQEQDNGSDVDITEEASSSDIKKELVESLSKDKLLNHTNNNNNNSLKKDKAQTKQSLRMQSILDKATGVATEAVPPPVLPSKDTGSNIELSKSTVAQTVVKYLTKYLQQGKIKDKVIIIPLFVCFHVAIPTGVSVL